MKKHRKYHMRLICYTLVLVGIAGLIAFSCFNTWQKIYENRRLKEELEQKYSNLVDKEETLSGEVVKLQDPEYAAKYAREKYLYSKDGELIIDMSQLQE
ncbi:MAG: septum formation initiator family protein [Bacilli bacterium]|nr:septum formation initiator family protein [Bacilli bacterium]